MNKSTQSLNLALHKFVEALHEYQAATRDMNYAMNKVARHTQTFCKPLKAIIQTSGSMVAPSRV
ncbi:MAG: hypothetical protein WCL27_14685 [Betaproteobacteria bacterium]